MSNNLGNIAETWEGDGFGLRYSTSLRKNKISTGPPNPAHAAIWNNLKEAKDLPPRGEPGTKPIPPDMTKNRLSEMLGPNSEIRKTQIDYTTTNCRVFDKPDNRPNPILLLSEAGTGTGKLWLSCPC